MKGERWRGRGGGWGRGVGVEKIGNWKVKREGVGRGAGRVV